jgi:hypothetical protein
MTLRKTRTIFYGIVGVVAFHTLPDPCTAYWHHPSAI